MSLASLARALALQHSCKKSMLPLPPSPSPPLSRTLTSSSCSGIISFATPLLFFFPSSFHLFLAFIRRQNCTLPALLKATAAHSGPGVKVGVGFAHFKEVVAMANLTTSLNWHSYNGIGNGAGLQSEIDTITKIVGPLPPPPHTHTYTDAFLFLFLRLNFICFFLLSHLIYYLLCGVVFTSSAAPAAPAAAADVGDDDGDGGGDGH